MLHLLLFRFWIFDTWIPVIPVPHSDPVVLVPMPAPGDLAQTPVTLSAPGRAGAHKVHGRTSTFAGTDAPPAAAPPPVPANRAVTTPPAAAPVPPAVDTGTGRPGSSRRIAPQLANGKLWVEPMLLPPKELAARLRRSHAELVDSAVASLIQAFLDSIAADPSSRGMALPNWTTTLAGKKFGLDSRNIYVAGLKIPAAVLALLPLPHGNESQAFDRSGWLYADLRAASARAANVEDFKHAIRDIRERKESEREFARNQRLPPQENPQ